MFKKAIYFTLFLWLVVHFPTVSLAQGPVDPSEDPEIPIDGGVSLLLAAGAAYGTKKLINKRKAKK
jgi:hypothetical protein